MSRIRRLVFLALLVQTAFAQMPANNELAVLKNVLIQKTVSSFVVLRLPDEIETWTSVTPETLRKFGAPLRKYNIDMNADRTALLLDWIKQTKYARRKYSPDCRWGLLFTDRSGNEVASIFSDKFGFAGNVDGHDLDFPDRSLLDTMHRLVGSQVK